MRLVVDRIMSPLKDTPDMSLLNEDTSCKTLESAFAGIIGLTQDFGSFSGIKAM
jgi:hypothetical protein